jgi:hypothetical protein
MEKIKSQSYGKLTNNKNLPSLKSSMLLSKGMLAISKVDIDSRAIQQGKNQVVIAAIEREHQRSQSGFNLRKPPSK